MVLRISQIWLLDVSRKLSVVSHYFMGPEFQTSKPSMICWYDLMMIDMTIKFKFKKVAVLNVSQVSVTGRKVDHESFSSLRSVVKVYKLVIKFCQILEVKIGIESEFETNIWERAFRIMVRNIKSFVNLRYSIIS